MIGDSRYHTNATQREHIRNRAITGTLSAAVLAAVALTVVTGPVVALAAMTLFAGAVTVRQLARTRDSATADTPDESEHRGSEPATAD
jgi:VanZ family protein